MNWKLNNGTIAIEVAEHGAEMKSLTREGRQYLWTGDPKFWSRCAPILFPAVGKPYRDEIHVDGTAYPLKQHVRSQHLRNMHICSGRRLIWFP